MKTKIKKTKYTEWTSSARRYMDLCNWSFYDLRPKISFCLLCVSVWVHTCLTNTMNCIDLRRRWSSISQMFSGHGVCVDMTTKYTHQNTEDIPLQHLSISQWTIDLIRNEESTIEFTQNYGNWVFWVKFADLFFFVRLFGLFIWSCELQSRVLLFDVIRQTEWKPVFCFFFWSNKYNDEFIVFPHTTHEILFLYFCGNSCDDRLFQLFETHTSCQQILKSARMCVCVCAIEHLWFLVENHNNDWIIIKDTTTFPRISWIQINGLANSGYSPVFDSSLRIIHSLRILMPQTELESSHHKATAHTTNIKIAK